MILIKDQITLNDTVVFSKFVLETPLEEPLFLPSDACYLYIEKGDGHSLEPTNRIKADPGTAILSACGLTVGSMIASQPKGSMATTVVHFNKQILEELFAHDKPELWEELESPINEYVIQSAADKLVKSYFDGLLMIFDNKSAITDALIKLKLKEIIHLLLQTSNAVAVRKIVKSLFSTRTFTFKELIDAHILTHAGVENLASLTHMSLSTFKRQFQDTYGDTPARYLLKQRLKQVAIDLRVTDEPISQIGYKYGFESPEHLSRSFKKQFEVSPSQFRSKNSQV